MIHSYRVLTELKLKRERERKNIPLKIFAASVEKDT